MEQKNTNICNFLLERSAVKKYERATSGGFRFTEGVKSPDERTNILGDRSCKKSLVLCGKEHKEKKYLDPGSSPR